MTLDQLPVGQQATVIAFRAEVPSLSVLSALGLLPGCVVTVERLAPLGDPISVRFLGQRISVRKRDAENVVVTGS